MFAFKIPLQALGKTLGTGDDSGDQDVIAKFLRVKQEDSASLHI